MQVDPNAPQPQPAQQPGGNPQVQEALNGDNPPAGDDIEITGPQRRQWFEAEKGQKAWHAFKLFCVVLVTPVALPFVALYVVGWTLTSLATSDSPSEFKQDVKDVFRKVLKPYTHQIDGIIGGIAGYTGKAYRMAKKEQARAPVESDIENQNPNPNSNPNPISDPEEVEL